MPKLPDDAKDRQIEEIRRELVRRSNDQVKVHNPWSEDREVIWDRFVHVVPANGEAVLPRYIAEKFVRETTDFLIMDRNRVRVEKENKKRVKAGQKEMDPQERETFDLRTNNKDLRAEYVRTIYRGVVSEYGKQEVARKRRDPVAVGDLDLIANIDKELGELPVPEMKPISAEPLSPEVEEEKQSIAEAIQ